MSVRQMTVTSRNDIPGPIAGILLALALLTGCSARLKCASPGYGDTCLHLCSTGRSAERFQCGTDAARQVIQYYRPDIHADDIRTESLLFAEANDTVSILHCLRDNVDFPVTMQNATVDALLDSIASANPVVVFLPGDAFKAGGFDIFGTWMLHCIVVVGHNAKQTELYFHSDGDGPYVISRDVFEREWARVDNLCILRAR
jgi:hypothetical protein